MSEHDTLQLAEVFRLGGVSARILFEEGGTLDFHTVIFETTSGEPLAEVTECYLDSLAKAAEVASVLIDWMHGSMNVIELAAKLRAFAVEPQARPHLRLVPSETRPEADSTEAASGTASLT